MPLKFCSVLPCHRMRFCCPRMPLLSPRQCPEFCQLFLEMPSLPLLDIFFLLNPLFLSFAQLDQLPPTHAAAAQQDMMVRRSRCGVALERWGARGAWQGRCFKRKHPKWRNIESQHREKSRIRLDRCIQKEERSRWRGGRWPRSGGVYPCHQTKLGVDWAIPCSSCGALPPDPAVVGCHLCQALL